MAARSKIVIAAVLACSCMISAFRMQARRPPFDRQKDEKPVYEVLGASSQGPRMHHSLKCEVLLVKEKGVDGVLVLKAARNDAAAATLQREVEILHMLKNDALAGLPVVLLVDANARVTVAEGADMRLEHDSFITPLYAQGNLLDNFNKPHLAESDRTSLLCSVAIRIMTALRRLHGQHGIAHRDVKPHNIFLDANGKCFLADFDIGFFGHEEKNSIAGTPGYKSPDIDVYKPFADFRRWDWYSFGMVLLEIAMAEEFQYGSGYSKGLSPGEVMTHARVMELLSSKTWLPRDAQTAIASLLAPRSTTNLDIPAVAEAFIGVFAFGSDEQDLALAQHFLEDGADVSENCEAERQVCCFTHNVFGFSLGITSAKLTQYGCEKRCGDTREVGLASHVRGIVSNSLLPALPRCRYSVPECDRSCTRQCIINEMGLLPEEEEA